MDVVKYFYEEPAALEVLAPDDDPDARRRDAPARSLDDFLSAPRAYRGYLAGTRLSPLRVGLTALDADAWLPPLLDAFAAPVWIRADADGHAEPLDARTAADAFRTPSNTALLLSADTPPDPDLVAAAAAGDGDAGRRYALPALRRLLDAAHVVFLPEPAHDGHDWSLFSTRPLRADFEAALRRHPHPAARRFVLPFRRARSEEKFYFERHDIERFAEFEV